MKKYFLIILILLITIPVFSENISGIYQWNSNNYRGWLELSVSGTVMTGTVHLYESQHDTKYEVTYPIAEGKVTYLADGGLKIEFFIIDGQIRRDMPHVGWFSVDRKVIAGNFQYTNGFFAWYAVNN